MTPDRTALDRAVEDGWLLLDLAVLNKHTDAYVSAKAALESAIAARACAPLIEALEGARDALLGTAEWDHPAVRAIDRALAAHREAT